MNGSLSWAEGKLLNDHSGQVCRNSVIFSTRQEEENLFPFSFLLTENPMGTLILLDIAGKLLKDCLRIWRKVKLISKKLERNE